MDEHDSGDLGTDFEFGPGTDLVLSMLAFLLVVLGLVHVANTNAVTNPPGPAPSPDKPKMVELHDAALAIFEQGSARLTPAGAQLLREKVTQLAAAAIEDRANVLRIKGYASPVPKPLRLAGGKLDGNLDLSAERSTEIAHAVHVLGMPYACIAVEGYGRSRSPLLQRYLFQHQITIGQWDEKFEQGCSAQLTAAECAQLRSEIEKLYQQERRVDLVVAREADAPCTTEELQAGLKAVAAQ